MNKTRVDMLYTVYTDKIAYSLDCTVDGPHGAHRGYSQNLDEYRVVCYSHRLLLMPRSERKECDWIEHNFKVTPSVSEIIEREDPTLESGRVVAEELVFLLGCIAQDVCFVGKDRDLSNVDDVLEILSSIAKEFGGDVPSTIDRFYAIKDSLQKARPIGMSPEDAETICSLSDPVARVDAETDFLKVFVTEDLEDKEQEDTENTT